MCIRDSYWKKPWGYLDEVIDATQTVYEQNNHTVSLSEPLKELEEQLNQIKMSVLLSKQAAKQAEEKKNEIIMYLAHDIRTPLTTVIGYLSLLHEAPDMPEQQKEKYVKVALNKAERLEKLINELFEITKYNAHTVIIKKETVDLHCLIAQVIDEIYPTLSANGNTAVFTAEDNLSLIHIFISLPQVATGLRLRLPGSFRRRGFQPDLLMPQGALLRRGRSDSFTSAKPEEDAVGNQCRIRPVSYTHLDVYKRQVTVDSVMSLIR